MLQSFPYIADEQTLGLIIGSMPGEASLAAGEYYAHPRNLLWKFVFEAFGEHYAGQGYPEKTAILRANRLGMWDALESCERAGSLDAGIKNVRPNDFAALLAKYPQIKCLLFNGRKAHDLFARFHRPLMVGRETYLLPSTSPANASVPLAERRREWLAALRLTSKKPENPVGLDEEI